MLLKGHAPIRKVNKNKKGAEVFAVLQKSNRDRHVKTFNTHQN